MTSRDFCFWLQGYFEIAKPETIQKENVEMIQRHLNLVFKHEIDPSYTNDKDKQNEMQHIHDGIPMPKIPQPPFNPGCRPEEIILRC